MVVKMQVNRSAEWCKEQSLLRGCDVRRDIDIGVEVSDLSLESRRVLYVNEGYSGNLGFNNRYLWTHGWSYGREYLLIDSDAPTVAEIDAAILAADERLRVRREEDLVRQKAVQEEAEAKRKSKEEHEAKLAEARQLLAKELAELEKVKEDRQTLAEFLSRVPDDALRGTLKAMAHTQQAIDELRERVENASPKLLIFASDDDSDNEDND